MATDLSQDTVLQYLRDGGGSVKNADLLLHFRNFIRDHADRDRNRELFKKYVNTVATVQQLDGVSYVVLRRKFKGRVPGGRGGGSSGPPRPSSGTKREPSPGNARVSPGLSAEKPRQKPQPREVTSSAQPGLTATETILPAAGIMLNYNNNVETNFNLRQPPEINEPGFYGGPAAGQTPSLSQSFVPDQSSKTSLTSMEFNHPTSGITPVFSAARYHGETRQQIPVQEPLRGREAELKTPSFAEPPAQDWNTRIKQHEGVSAPPPSDRPHMTTAVRQYKEVRQQIQAQEPPRGQEAELKTPSFSEPLAQDWSKKVGQHEVGYAPQPSGTAPEVSAVRQYKEVRQQIPVQEPYGRRGVELQTPNISEPPAPDQSSNMGQQRMGFIPPSSGVTPVVSAVRQHGETRQQIPIQKPFIRRDAEQKTPSLSVHPAPDQSSKLGQQKMGFAPADPSVTPMVPAGEHQKEAIQVNLRVSEAGLQPERSPHQEPSPNQTNLKSQVAPRRHRHRKSYKSAMSCDEDEEEEEEEEQKVPVRRGSAGGEWPLSVPLVSMGKAISASSPCIIDVPSVVPSSSSSEKGLPKIYVQDVEEERLPPRGGPGWSSESGAGLKGQWAGTGLEPGSVRHSLPVENYRQSAEVAPRPDVNADRRYSQPAGVLPEQRLGGQQNQRGSLSSSTSNIYSPSSDSGLSMRDWPMSSSPRGSGWNSSLEDLRARTGMTRSESPIQEVLQRAQRTKAEPSMLHGGSKIQAPWHHSTGHLHDDQEHKAHLSPFHHSSDHLHDNQQSAARVMPWHLSTGDLHDNHQEVEVSESSTPSPTLQVHTGIPRRLSSHLRSRMCRSMGADLDQLLQEEGGGSEAARLNRLHLISSSLSLGRNLSSSSLSSCSTPPRSHSVANLAEEVKGKGRKKSLASSSSAHPEGSGRQSQVPLESREHDWLVKGAAGAWPDIYSLFREDHTLLNRQDFISGFTVLHWIAKHGDHRVLNTLWYGVQKAGLSFNINAKSTCGHTPLHIAAIHGNKNIMRLLVSKFGADLKLRDTAGKKPWQYLSRNNTPDVFQLLGAPPRAALGEGGAGGVGRVESNWRQEKQHGKRRKQHLSSASFLQKPNISAKVKRSSSIAAYLKHKSMQHFHKHQSDSFL